MMKNNNSNLRRKNEVFILEYSGYSHRYTSLRLASQSYLLFQNSVLKPLGSYIHYKWLLINKFSFLRLHTYFRRRLIQSRRYCCCLVTFSSFEKGEGIEGEKFKYSSRRIFFAVYKKILIVFSLSVPSSLAFTLSVQSLEKKTADQTLLQGIDMLFLAICALASNGGVIPRGISNSMDDPLWDSWARKNIFMLWIWRTNDSYYRCAWQLTFTLVIYSSDYGSGRRPTSANNLNVRRQWQGRRGCGGTSAHKMCTKVLVCCLQKNISSTKTVFFC